MSSDDLRKAHARIRLLEQQLAEANRTPLRDPGRSRRIMTGAIFVLTIAFISVWTGLRFAQRNGAGQTPTVVVEALPASPPAVATADALTFQCLDNYPFGPSFIDVDGDGAREIVSLAWWDGGGHDQAALHVVAFNRASLAVKWRSSAYAASCTDLATRLVVSSSDRRILVRDDANRMHALDPRTGQEITSYLDEGGRPSSLPKPIIDHRLPPVETTSDDKKAFVTAAIRKLDGALSARTAMSISAFDLVDGPSADQITIASAHVSDLETRTMAFRFDTAHPPTILWQVPIHSPEEKELVDPPKAINAWTMLSGGKLAHLYQRSDSRYAISIRNAKTGALVADRPLTVDGARIAAGAPIHGVTSDANDVVFYLGESLVIFDMDALTTRTIRIF